MKYKNTGAPFLRHDGETWVDTHEIFEPTEGECAQFAYKLELVKESEEDRRLKALLERPKYEEDMQPSGPPPRVTTPRRK